MMFQRQTPFSNRRSIGSNMKEVVLTSLDSSEDHRLVVRICALWT